MLALCSKFRRRKFAEANRRSSQRASYAVTLIIVAFELPFCKTERLDVLLGSIHIRRTNKVLSELSKYNCFVAVRRSIE
jgi:hypothetical protein